LTEIFSFLNISVLELSKFAAIDIGSNSVRLLISNVIEQNTEPLFKKSALIRVPVRLGADAFTEHQIPDQTIARLVDAMKGFYFIMQANNVLAYRGCATSALREAANGETVIEQIQKEAGIKIDIISGNEEADLIYASQYALAMQLQTNCLFVDVGGGSTEVTIFSRGKVVNTTSFRIGTIRILNEQVERATWKQMKDWLKENIGQLKDFSLIGSGGNINRISKLTQLKPGKAMSFEKLEDVVEEIRNTPMDDRIKVLDLNPDRADVIVPAGEIFITIMKWIDAKKIYVPKIGLGDGIVRDVYKRYKEGSSAQPVLV
jgi:exopolyphosphatase/guanosine-5'-triphosphate,3'-diphosphate pyrophosphatase